MLLTRYQYSRLKTSACLVLSDCSNIYATADFKCRIWNGILGTAPAKKACPLSFPNIPVMQSSREELFWWIVHQCLPCWIKFNKSVFSLLLVHSPMGPLCRKVNLIISCITSFYSPPRMLFPRNALNEYPDHIFWPQNHEC